MKKSKDTPKECNTCGKTFYNNIPQEEFECHRCKNPLEYDY